MLMVLSLFAGIGGIDLGLERAGMTTVAQCEIDPFCNAVLEKHWPNVTRYTDVRTLDGNEWRGRVDVVAGGFPCTDCSVAGKGEGLGTEEAPTRSGLWFEMRRIIAECRPRWVLAENVPALRTRGGDTVLADLESIGYAAWPVVVGAWTVGAPHRRERVWIIANSDSERVSRQVEGSHPGRHGQRRKGGASHLHDWPTGWVDGRGITDQGEPAILGADDGIPDWMDRVRSIGNSVVPQVVEVIGRWIVQQEKIPCQ